MSHPPAQLTVPSLAGAAPAKLPERTGTWERQ